MTEITCHTDHLSRYAVTSGDRRVPLGCITHFQADSKYVVAHHAGGELVLSFTLRQIEAFLGDEVLRIHRSTLVMRRLVTRTVWQDRRVYLRDLDKPLRASTRLWGSIKSAVRTDAGRLGCTA